MQLLKKKISNNTKQRYKLAQFMKIILKIKIKSSEKLRPHEKEYRGQEWEKQAHIYSKCQERLERMG